jgi:ketosteroid isomerase-like protein
MFKKLSTKRLFTGAVILLIVSFSANTYAHGEDGHKTKDALFVGLDSDAAKTVAAFHKALKEGDEKAARATLADDVLIYEGGVERSADEYANHHMLADMKYVAQINSTLLEQQVTVLGDLAYSVTRTQTKGQYKNKSVDYVGFETIVLKKIDNVWLIAHIHWSK